MPTLITLSSGENVFCPKDMEAVLSSIAGKRPLSDSTYTVPPGFIMVDDDGAQRCVNASQVAMVRAVANRPILR